MVIVFFYKWIVLVYNFIDVKVLLMILSLRYFSVMLCLALLYDIINSLMKSNSDEQRITYYSANIKS